MEMYCTKRRVVMQRGVEERNFAERAGHLESLGGKKEKWQQSRLLAYPLLALLEISDLCKHTHTPNVFLYAPPRSHTQAHTHNSSDRDRCGDALMHTHTFLVSHPAIVAQHHSPWCFTAVFPGTVLSLVQSRLSKNSSHFQLGEEAVFSWHTLKAIPPLLLFKTYTTCKENAELWKSGRMEWEEEQGGERQRAGRERGAVTNQWATERSAKDAVDSRGWVLATALMNL